MKISDITLTLLFYFKGFLCLRISTQIVYQSKPYLIIFEILSGYPMSIHRVTADYIDSLNKLLQQNSTDYSGAIDYLFKVMDTAIEYYHVDNSVFKKGVVYMVGAADCGQSAFLNYLMGKQLKVVKDYQGDIRLELQNKSGGVAAIGQGSDSTETLYPNIYTDSSIGVTYVDNPGDPESRGIAQQILNSYIKKHLGGLIGQFKILVLFPYDLLHKKQGANFIKQLNILAENSADSQVMKEYVTLIFTKVPANKTQMQVIKQLNKIKSQQFYMLNPVSQNLLASVIKNNRVGLFFSPSKDQENKIYENPAKDKDGKDQAGTGQSLFNLIQMAPYYNNKKGHHILKLNISSHEKLRQIIKNYEGSFNKRIIKVIKQVFIQKTNKFEPFHQLEKISKGIVDSVIYKNPKAENSEVIQLYKFLGLSSEQAELQLKPITFLNQILGKNKFIIEYGSIHDEYQKLGIKKFLQIKTEFKFQNREMTVSGVNIILEKQMLKQYFIELNSLYQITFSSKSPSDPGLLRRKKVSIISPIWGMIGNFSLELRGRKGRSAGINTSNLNAILGNINFSPGPGEKGGDFLGIALYAYCYPNSQLKISSIGGDGSPGIGGSQTCIGFENGRGTSCFTGFGTPGGKGGDPGVIELAIMEKNIPNKVILEQRFGGNGASSGSGEDSYDPKQYIPKPLNYDPVIRYEKYLMQFFDKGGLQKQVAFNNFSKYFSQDFSAVYRPKNGKGYSKLEIQHLITEVKWLAQMCKQFLNQKDTYFTGQQLLNLAKGFKEKLILFNQKQFFSLDEIQQKALLKIITNTLLVEQSLEKAFAIVNFEYLNYFYETRMLEYQKIVQAQQKYKYQTQKQKKQKEFMKKIEQKIKQAQLITNQIQTQIQKISDKVDDQIKILKNALEKAQKQKQKYAQKLKKQAPLKVASGLLKFAGKVAGLFGPKGKAIGAGMQAGAGVMNLFVTPPQPVKGKDLSPATYLNMDNGLNSLLLAQAFDDLRPIDISSKIPQIKKIQQEVQQSGGVIKYYEIVEGILENLNQNLNEIVNQQKDSKQQKNKKLGQNSKNKQKASKASAALDAFSVAQHGITFIKETTKTMDDIDKATNESKQFKKMKGEFNQFIDKTMKNFLSKMGSANTVFQKSGSQARVYFLEYGFTETLKDIQHFLKKALGSFEYPQKDDFFYIFNKFEAALQTLSKIYSSIDNYRSQGELGNLIITASKEDYRLEQKYPGFYQLQAYFQKLVVLKQGNDILNSIKQSAFPSQPYYSYSNYRDILKKTDEKLKKDQSINALMQTLKNAYNQHKLSKSVIEDGGGIQSVIKQQKNIAFCTEANANMIYFFLRGQPIVFFSDVRLSPTEKDALKFREINVKLELNPSIKQIPEDVKNKFKELEGNLRANFGVQMSSSGVYYNLPSAQLDLARAYDPEKKDNYFESKLYTKVAQGQPMFSPYTTWKLKLTRESNAKIAFDSLLEKCIEYMQLTLYGSGVFIDTSAFGNKAYKLIKVHDCYKSFETQVFQYIPFQGA